MVTATATAGIISASWSAVNTTIDSVEVTDFGAFGVQIWHDVDNLQILNSNIHGNGNMGIIVLPYPGYTVTNGLIDKTEVWDNDSTGISIGNGGSTATEMWGTVRGFKVTNSRIHDNAASVRTWRPAYGLRSIHQVYCSII